MNLPNLLTLFRIVLVPVIVIFLIQESYLKALFAFILAGITDGLDGLFARIMHQKTVLGTYLDPLADKALISTCFVTLSILGIIPGWITVIVISRDIIILLGVSVLALTSVPFEVHPTLISKLTTAFQLLAVFMALLSKSMPDLMHYPGLFYLYWVTGALTVVSGMNYIMRGLKLINDVGQN